MSEPSLDADGRALLASLLAAVGPPLPGGLIPLRRVAVTVDWLLDALRRCGVDDVAAAAVERECRDMLAAWSAPLN